MARGETLNTVIGQGFMLSTPLQIAIMTARLATGKRLSHVSSMKIKHSKNLI